MAYNFALKEFANGTLQLTYYDYPVLDAFDKNVISFEKGFYDSDDRFMDKLAVEFPQYGWEQNKGYLSSAHIQAIKDFGVTKWHRKKFLRKILDEQKDEQLSLF